MATETFIITRGFAAPLASVWLAWTKPDMLAAWFGPKDATCDIIGQDFRVGGYVHSSLRMQDGSMMWGKFTYQDIVPEHKLSWLHSFTDAAGTGLVRHPYNAAWPLVLLTTVAFEAEGGTTKVVLTWTPYEADAAERKAFVEAMQGMNQGWGGSFDQLDEFLAKKKAA